MTDPRANELVERLRKGYDTSLYDKAADEIDKAANEIERLRERCETYKGQVEAGAALIDSLHAQLGALSTAHGADYEKVADDNWRLRALITGQSLEQLASARKALMKVYQTADVVPANEGQLRLIQDIVLAALTDETQVHD